MDYSDRHYATDEEMVPRYITATVIDLAIPLPKRALLTEWDPIGVAEFDEALDESDAYVPAIYKMLIARKPRHEIVSYLWWLETEHMGFVRR